MFIFIIVNIFYFQTDASRLTTNMLVFGGSIGLIMSLGYYVKVYNSTSSERITKDPIFWLATALLLDYGSGVPFTGLLNYFVENHREFAQFYVNYVINIFLIIAHICKVIAFIELCRTLKKDV